MLIGITYDLKQDYLKAGFSEEAAAEFDKPETIEGIERSLRDLGFKTDRIGHIKELSRRLTLGDRWDMVFNIAEGIKGFGREAQIPCLLDAYDIPYTFSDPMVLSLALHKGMTKHVIRDLGIPTPAFAVVEHDGDWEHIDLPLPLFAKPIAEGTGKGISSASQIHKRNQLAPVCRKLMKEYNQPILLETFLTGREFTVGIVGTAEEAKVLGTIEIMLREEAEKGAYSYINKDRYEEYVEYRLCAGPMAKRAEEVALAAWRGLGCRDAGRIDIRANANGELNFIEVNPLAGLHPKHSDLPIICRMSGITYLELIEMIMESAIKRLYANPPATCRHATPSSSIGSDGRKETLGNAL